MDVAVDTMMETEMASSTGAARYCVKMHAASASLFWPATSAMTIMLFAVGVHVTIMTTRKKESSPVPLSMDTNCDRTVAVSRDRKSVV